jgi:thiamine-phosphate pyrophosphorylase
LTGDAERLWRTARTLGRLHRRAKPPKSGRGRLPPLLALTDPLRTPDPVALAQRLPRGAGLVYRAFGADGARVMAARLETIAAQRGLMLLIGAGDPALAGAGVHLPQRMAGTARRFRRPGRLVTAAAHDGAALRRARLAGCDAVLVSAVFASRSPSAGKPMGPVRFAALARTAGLPVYALGGVNARTARRLIKSGAAGLAVVEALTAPEGSSA